MTAASFLAAAGWGAAAAEPLAGDASARRYHRMRGAGGTAVLMEDPGGEAPAFLDVARRLAGAGVSVPGVLAAEAEAGLVLLEDLGDGLIATLTDPAEALGTAVELLAALQAVPGLSDGLPAYDAGFALAEAALVLEWYLPAMGRPAGPTAEGAFLREMSELLAGGARAVFVHRDYHGENLFWLPGRTGAARVGVIDFQGARAGSAAYDLASLVRDARRDLAPGLRAALVARYRAAGGQATDAELAIWGVQRNLKILGLFARLARRDGKPRYLVHMPRVWAHLEADLAHPALAGLAAWVAAHVPPPDPARLMAA